MHTVVMPKMGDTMEEGKILNWLKHEGDTVAKGDALAEIETDKVNIEVEAFAAGVLRKIVAQEGDSIPIGEPIAYIGDANEALPAEASTGAAAPSATTAASAPQPAAATHGEGQAEAAPKQVAPEQLAQPATASVAAAPASGGANGRSAGTALPATPSTNGATAASSNGNGYAAETATTANGGRIFISPIAKRIAVEHNIDTAHIEGTGPGGRIIREDVEAALARQQQAAPPAAQIPAAPVPAAAAGEEVEALPLSNIRRTIAKRLQQSMQTAPHFYVTVSIDTTRLGELRSSINEYAAELPEPIKISFNDLIVKGVATALTHMPQVNVSFDGDRLLLKKHVNVGVAVALEQGLIVPVVRDADKHGVLDIAKETRRLVDAARNGKLKPEEFQGGTFSVSNLGMFDVEEFTAIINPPEAGILAVGAIVPTPVVRDGQVVVRNMMKVTMSVDHRALDGATAARFLQEVKRLLEQPLGMLV